MNLIFSILHGILGAIGFFTWLTKQSELRSAMQQGIQAQVAEENAAALHTETAIAQAQAAAPDNVQQVEARLDKGTF